jgi:hypothetical protein
MQESTVLAMPSGNYVAFTDALEMQIHNPVHVRVGGTMVQTWSPEAPEFFLHHNHIDEIWNRWQLKGAAWLGAYSFSLNLPMPVAYGATPGDYNDLKTTKVQYTRSGAGTAGAGHFIFAACNLIKLPLSALSVDLNVLQTAIFRASPTQLLQIPQLAAPVLTTAEQGMLLAMMKGGPERAVQEFSSRLRAAQDTLQKSNAALKSAGSLRDKFQNPIDQALGFDVAKAVALLKVPNVTSTETVQRPSLSSRTMPSASLSSLARTQARGR